MNLETAVVQTETGSSAGGKFLTLCLADEEYGIDILKVQEIIPMMTITNVPRTPDFVRGVINLRGKIIPVTDLRRKFGMKAKEHDSETCIIVVRVEGMDIGIIVDKVLEVLDIASADIKDAPSFGSEVRTDFLLGVGNTNGRVRLLLDIEQILSTQETIELNIAVQTA